MKVVNGGINNNTITVELSSKPGHGINSTINLYVYEKAYLTHPTLE